MMKRKKSAVFVLIAALLFSLPLPVMAQDGEEAGRAAENSGPEASAVEAAAVAGDIEGAVVGIEKCQSGGYYVQATENQREQSDILESDGLYLYRYDESLDRVVDEYSVGTGGSYSGDLPVRPIRSMWIRPSGSMRLMITEMQRFLRTAKEISISRISLSITVS